MDELYGDFGQRHTGKIDFQVAMIVQVRLE